MADETVAWDLMDALGAGRPKRPPAAAPAAQRTEGADDAVAFLTDLAERGQQMTSAAGLNTARAAMMDAVRLKARAGETAHRGYVSAEWMIQPPMSMAEWMATFATQEAWEHYFADLAAEGPEALRQAVTPHKSGPGQLSRSTDRPPGVEG